MFEVTKVHRGCESLALSRFTALFVEVGTKQSIAQRCELVPTFGELPLLANEGGVCVRINTPRNGPESTFTRRFTSTGLTPLRPPMTAQVLLHLCEVRPKGLLL